MVRPFFLPLLHDRLHDHLRRIDELILILLVEASNI